jgi:adenosylmethionine-8-amino-7-oxononanoate aminotransferase
VAAGQPSRHKVIHRAVSYHGNTLGTLSLSGRPGLRAPYEPLLSASPRAVAPFCYHCPLDRAYPECGVACVEDLQAVIEREGPDKVTAYIGARDRSGSWGRRAARRFARRAREICTRYGVPRRRGDEGGPTGPGFGGAQGGV